MKKNTRFPLFIDLKDKPVIVFGGGKIATRRVETLLDFKARVIVVAPEVSERISFRLFMLSLMTGIMQVALIMDSRFLC